MAATGAKGDGHAESAFRSMSGNFNENGERAVGSSGDWNGTAHQVLTKQTITLLGSDSTNSVAVYGRDVTVVSSEASMATAEGSNKVQVTKVVTYDWDVRPYFGHFVAIDRTHTCIAYVLNLKGKAASVVRLINRHEAQKALIKDYSSFVVDIAFSIVADKMLASVEENGSLFVHRITDKPLSATLVLHLMYTPSGFNGVSPSHRVVWCPFIPEEGVKEQPDDARHLLAVTFDSRVLMVNVSIIRAQEPVWPVNASNLTGGVLEVASHLKSIMDVAFSPDGTALATASADGFVKFFQVSVNGSTPARCLHEWLPHEGRMLTSLFFLDDHKQPDSAGQFWKYAVTGAENNRELKIWSCETWTCLQTLRFTPSPKSSVEPHLIMAADLSARHLVLSDINRKVLYVLQLHQASNMAHVSGLSEFLLTAPCLSFAVVDASLSTSGVSDLMQSHVPCEDYDTEDVFSSFGGSQGAAGPRASLYLVAIQPKELNEMVIRYQPQVSVALGDSLAASSVGTLYAPSSTSLDTSTADPLLQLSLSNASSMSKSVLLTPNSFTLASPGASSSLTRVTALLDAEHPSVTAGASSPSSCRASLDSPLASAAADLVLSSAAHVARASNAGGRDSSDLLLVRSLSAEKPAADAGLFSMDQDRTASISTGLSASSTSSHSDHNRVKNSTANILSSLAATPVAAEATATSVHDDSALLHDEETQQAEQEVHDKGPTVPESAGRYPSATEADILDDIKKEEDVISSASEDEGEASNLTAAGLGPWPLAPQLPPQGTIAEDLHQRSPSYDHRPFSASEAELSNEATNIAQVRTSERIEGAIAADSQAIDHVDVTCCTEGWDGLDAGIVSDASKMQSATAPKSDRQDRRTQEQPATVMDSRILETLSSLLRSVEAQGEELRLIRNEQRMHQQAAAAIAASPTQTMLRELERVEGAINAKLDVAASTASRRDAQQQKAVTAAVQRSSADSKEVIERTISLEVKKGLAPVLQHLTELVRKELPSIVAERLVLTETAVKDHLGKLVTSKQTVDAIAEAVGNIVQGTTTVAYRDVMQQMVLPSFEGSTKKMFQQLNTTFHNGTQEYIKNVQSHFDTVKLRQQNSQEMFSSRMEELCTAASTASAEMQASRQQLTSAMHQQTQHQSGIEAQLQRSLGSLQATLLAELRRLVHEEVRTALTQLQASLNAQIAGSLAEAVTRAGAATPLPTSGAAMDFDQYKMQLATLLARKELNAAFRLALSASDLTKVMYLLKQADVSVVFGQVPCLLQQPVILSLVQQLTQDLENEADFEVKYQYLQEGILNLDLNDAVTREHGPSVISDLCEHLSNFIRANGSSPMSKPLKMLLMAAQSLLRRK